LQSLAQPPTSSQLPDIALPTQQPPPQITTSEENATTASNNANGAANATTTFYEASETDPLTGNGSTHMV